jgi:cell division protein FtsN
MAGGIGLGLAGVAMAIYLYHGWRGHNKTPRTSVAAAPQRNADGQRQNGVDAAKSGPEKQPYDFYTMLPNLKVIVPMTEDGGTAPPVNEGDEISGQGIYTLQVGSYRELSDADRVKAQLALLDIEADIYTVKVSEETWHRVVIGPYHNTDKLRQITSRLRKNNVNFMVTKIRG